MSSGIGKWIQRLTLILLVLLLLYVIYLLKGVWFPVWHILFLTFIPFFIGGFIAYLLHPIIERIHSAGIHRGIAIMMIYCIFFGAAGYGLYKGVPLLIVQLRELSDNIPMFADQYKHWNTHLQNSTSRWPDGVQQQINEQMQAFEQWTKDFLGYVVDLLLKIINMMFILAVIPFISFYFLKDINKVKRMCWYLTPRKWRMQGIRFLRDVNDSLGGYIRGQFIVCLAIGAISTAVLWFLGIHYPVLLGIVIGITNVIPYFGPVIGAIPALLIAASISIKSVIYVLILIVVLQFIEGNILSPLIVGKSLHMHPLFIIAALVIGGEAAGVIGMLLAVPILAVLKVALIHAKTHFPKSSSSEN
ncbi:AI-2E family transporter [Falsibacillus pallidus]|uniref:Putative PurR-regulated permease PerM n=1 Tax=Falsibacillus pallidus TaxID=493781 RepID=A0A370GL55_9BACI|nr:AI-2E family transporter [Falsibacillus pallidus]RDI44090.1 putative PurR-regulated permease PerM [Falsibacillus pallidus]